MSEIINDASLVVNATIVDIPSNKVGDELSDEQSDKLSGVLSDIQIIKRRKQDEIVIEPFNINNLNTSSYDVTLGEWYFRETFPDDSSLNSVYNMYSERMVKKVWGEAIQARTYKELSEENGVPILENISPDDKIIIINPGERILAHTNEYIGGRTHTTTMMKARSSMGRNFIETCSCAGWGDVGYINRWTMEITNNSRWYKIPLVVGKRIAQIIFFETGEVNGNVYGNIQLEHNRNNSGKYQLINGKNATIDDLKLGWEPNNMLPKLYLD